MNYRENDILELTQNIGSKLKGNLIEKGTKVTFVKIYDDPDNDGTGGPGYQFEDEFNRNAPKLVKGVLAMANSGINTNGSQFFIITTEDTPWLDGKHTPFGLVAEGLDVVDDINLMKTDDSDRPLKDVIIEDVILSQS